MYHRKMRLYANVFLYSDDTYGKTNDNAMLIRDLNTSDQDKFLLKFSVDSE